MEKKLTRFTFYNMYWNVIKNAKDEEIGRFIKAVCAFVFDDVPMAQPKTPQKVTNEEIDRQVEKEEYILSFDEFMKAHPHIVNDIYQSNKHLLDGILPIGRLSTLD